MTDRLYLPKIFEPTTYDVIGDELKHAKVLRLQKGDNLALVNGQGALGQGTVVQLEKRKLSVKIHTIVYEKPPLYCTTLAAALIKQNRLEILTEKAVEIGINCLYFYAADRSEKKNLSYHRLEKIAISALKQSGRLTLPQIKLFPSIRDVPQGSSCLYYGSPTASAKKAHPQKDALFYIGPEKGFSQEEVAFLEKKGASAVLLALPTLRAETAGILAAHFLEYAKCTRR